MRRYDLVIGACKWLVVSEERHALMLPQELKAFGFDKEIFFYEGIPQPVLCENIKYYQDKTFTSRLLPAVEVKKLTI